MAQSVKSLPAVQETRDPSLGQEDPLEKEMAAHSSILAWRMPWTEEPGRSRTGLSYTHTVTLCKRMGGGKDCRQSVALSPE